MDVALFLFSSRTLLSTRCLLSSLVSCGLLHLYPCTLVHLYPCTLVHLYPCTLVHLYPCAMRRRPARRQRLEPKTAADMTAVVTALRMTWRERISCYPSSPRICSHIRWCPALFICSCPVCVPLLASSPESSCLVELLYLCCLCDWMGKII